jgi:hypothetical protein
MQCASSTATEASPSARRRSKKPSIIKRSGATKRSFVAPRSSDSCTARRSPTLCALVSIAAGTPFWSRPSTWSFISEISGLTTTVSPSRTSAGAW